MKTTKKSITIEQALKAANDGKNQGIKQKFVGQHVYCNVGSLCEYALSKGFEDSNAPFTIDDIENYYSYPEYIGTYANFNGGNDDQRQEEIERLKDWDRTEENKEDVESEIEELENLESEPSEIYEWWAVSEYLYDKLKDMGHCVVDAGSCYVWGRTTTGQAILLDYCISIICAEMEILEGQSNAWA